MSFKAKRVPIGYQQESTPNARVAFVGGDFYDHFQLSAYWLLVVSRDPVAVTEFMTITNRSLLAITAKR